MTTVGEWQEALESLGQRLKLARGRRRWSRQSLADRMGVSRQTVERLECGDPGIRLETLAAALRVLSFPIADMDRIANPEGDAVGLSLEIARTPGFARKNVDPEDEIDFTL